MCEWFHQWWDEGRKPLDLRAACFGVGPPVGVAPWCSSCMFRAGEGCHLD